MDTWGEAKWTARDLVPLLDLEDWQHNFVSSALAAFGVPETWIYVGSPSGPKFENGFS